MKPRTRARSIALQALYEIDIAGHPPEMVLAERLSETPLEDNLSEFARSIVHGILPIVADLDQIIARHAPEWPLDQVATIDRNIMRIAL
jgi:N utilization substance protein B